MAGWKSYYRRKYRRYYRKKYGNSYSKRSYGQFKAAKQQADQASFVINIPTEISCFACHGTRIFRNPLTGEEYQNDVVLGTYALNIYDLLRKSEFYQSYANMYDEFKIDNIKVKLIPVKYNVTFGEGNPNGYQSFTVYTAWDRTGLNPQQIVIDTAGVYNNNYIDPRDHSKGKNYQFIGKYRDGQYDNDGIQVIVGEDITTYSSAESRQISVGQNSSITRWLKPKNMSEKSQWLSTSSLKQWYLKYDSTGGRFTYIPTFNANNDEFPIICQNNLGQVDENTLMRLNIAPVTKSNPCFLLEDPAINFKPTLLVGIYPAQTEEDVMEHPVRAVYFNVETEISCSFRGLRKSKVVPLYTEKPNPNPNPNPNPIQENNVQITYYDRDIQAAKANGGFLPFPSAYWAGKENQINIENPDLNYFTIIVNDFSNINLPNTATMQINNDVIALAKDVNHNNNITLPSPDFNNLTNFNMNNKSYMTDLRIDVSNLNNENVIQNNNAYCKIDDDLLHRVKQDPETPGMLTLPDPNYNNQAEFNRDGKNYETSIQIDLRQLSTNNQPKENLGYVNLSEEAINKAIKDNSGIITLPDPDFNDLVDFSRNDLNYETNLEIDVSNLENFVPSNDAWVYVTLNDQVIKAAQNRDQYKNVLNIPTDFFNENGGDYYYGTKSGDTEDKFNYSTHIQLKIKNIHLVENAKLDPNTAEVNMNTDLALINVDDDADIEVQPSSSSLQLIKLSDLPEYEEKLKRKYLENKKDVIMTTNEEDEDPNENPGTDDSEDYNPIINLGTIRINVPSEVLLQADTIGLTGPNVIGNNNISTAKLSDFENTKDDGTYNLSEATMNVDQAMISIIELPYNTNFYYIIATTVENVVPKHFCANLVPHTSEYTVWWKIIDLYQSGNIPSDRNLGFQLGYYNENNVYTTLQFTKNDFINSETNGYRINGIDLQDERNYGDYVRCSNGFVIEKKLLKGLKGTEDYDPIEDNYINRSIVQQLPINYTLNKKGFYVADVNNTPTDIPIFVNYNNIDGTPGVKTVSVVKPFKILDSYTTNEITQNGTYDYVFDNANTDVGEINLTNTPVNKVKVTVNVPQDGETEEEKREKYINQQIVNGLPLNINLTSKTITTPEGDLVPGIYSMANFIVNDKNTVPPYRTFNINYKLNPEDDQQYSQSKVAGYLQPFPILYNHTAVSLNENTTNSSYEIDLTNDPAMPVYGKVTIPKTIIPEGNTELYKIKYISFSTVGNMNLYEPIELNLSNSSWTQNLNNSYTLEPNKLISVVEPYNDKYVSISLHINNDENSRTISGLKPTGFIYKSDGFVINVGSGLFLGNSESLCIMSDKSFYYDNGLYRYNIMILKEFLYNDISFN